jgi:hypothetical protein
MDDSSDLKSINETLARGKSIIKESIDLTRKNAEKKKEIERRLKNYLNYGEPVKNSESSFTLDLDNQHFSAINSDKYLENSSESFRDMEKKLKTLKNRAELMEKEKKYAQNKLEEIQDFVKELEEHNLKLKSKLKVLIAQVKINENQKTFMDNEFESLNNKIKTLELENQKILSENTELKAENNKVIAENTILKKDLSECKQNIEEIQKKYEILEKKHKVLETKSPVEQIFYDDQKLALKIESQRKIDLENESSSENYSEYFKNLKNEIFEGRKGSLSSMESPMSVNRFKLKENTSLDIKKTYEVNDPQLTKKEILVNKLEQDYKITDEKIKKLPTNVFHIKSNSVRKFSSSFDNVKQKKTDKIATKSKPAAKTKLKRAHHKLKKPKKSNPK